MKKIKSMMGDHTVLFVLGFCLSLLAVSATDYTRAVFYSAIAALDYTVAWDSIFEARKKQG